jgi:hypothetical protein
MRIRHAQAFAAAMAALSTALAAGAWHVWTQPYPVIGDRDVAEWMPSDTLIPAHPETGETGVQFSQALSRPLFRQSRRPFVPAQIAAEPEPPGEPPVAEPAFDSSGFILRGILIEGIAKQALIATADAPEGVWLAPGSEVAGWKLVDLESDGVALAAGGRVVEIKLYVDNRAK